MYFLPSLKQSGHLEMLHLTLAFIGSRKLENSYEDYNEWTSSFAPYLSIYGFDADKTACDKTNAENASRKLNWFEKHYPFGLWSSSGKKTLYLTAHPGCSSLYPPSAAYLQRYSTHQAMMKVERTVEAEVTTLDEFCTQEEIREIDHIQIDVQGAALRMPCGH